MDDPMDDPSDDESEESLDHTNELDDCVVITGKPLTTKVNLLVKGGDVDDNGQPVEMSVDNRLHTVFYEYAARVGLRPKDLRLWWRGQLLAPEDTPFQVGMYMSEVILAYDKDGKGVAIDPPSQEPTSNKIVITICTVASERESIRFKIKKTASVKELYMKWGLSHNVDVQRVRLWVKGEDLNDEKNLEEEKVRDGATVLKAETTSGLMKLTTDEDKEKLAIAIFQLNSLLNSIVK